MRRFATRLLPVLLALLAAAAAGPLAAQGTETSTSRTTTTTTTRRAGGPDTPDAPVVAVVQRLFDAMAARDTASARALLLPGSQFVSARGDTTIVRPRVQDDTSFLRMLATTKDRLLERFWQPTVMVDGSIATVWAPYDFHVNGAWSHCGIDVVTLLKVGEAWQVTGITYTVQRRGCAPSPLGPPRA